MEKINKNINVKRLSDIESKPVERSLTGFPELDYIYGYSHFPNSPTNCFWEWGMPQSKISLWAGVSGVGKSRLCISAAKNFCKTYSEGRVLYFQTESTLEDFAGWAKDTTEYPNIYCSGENKLDKIIQIIYHIKPHTVFIDSVDEIEEFENGNKQEARRLIQGSNGMPGLRQAVNDVGCHLILLGQLNQDGKTIKGGTSLPHLVDIALDLVPTSDDSSFMVKVGTKHRYGKKDSSAIFKHIESGVIETSENRLGDSTWCNSYGIAMVDPNYDPDCPPGFTPTPEVPVYVPGMFLSTPENLARLDEYRKKHGARIARENGPGLYSKIGDFIGDILGK